MVTHFSTHWVWHRVTLLIKTTAQPLAQTVKGICVNWIITCYCYQIIWSVSWSTCLSLTSSVSSQSKMPQQDSFSTWDIVTIIDVLISLHSLRVPERIIFKVAMLTYRALHGSAPSYLASSFTSCVTDMLHRRRLRSASAEQLDVPTCRRSTIGGHAFPVAGAKVWNSLPSDVTLASSLSVFKNRPKTYLREKFHLVELNVLIKISSKQPKSYLFDVSTSIRGLHHPSDEGLW